MQQFRPRVLDRHDVDEATAYIALSGLHIYLHILSERTCLQLFGFCSAGLWENSGPLYIVEMRGALIVPLHAAEFSYNTLTFS